MPGLSRLRGLKVLVLEDDYYTAEDTRSALEEAEAVVIGPYADAAEAVAQADQRRPDCAVLDVNLGSGPDFRLAKAFVARGIPCIFVTGYDSDVMPAEFEHVTRLQKPVQSSELVAAVNGACTR